MAAKSTANRTATNKMSLSNRGVHQKMRRYSRTPFIRIKWDAEPPGYAENPDYWIFLWKRGSLNFGWQTVRTCASTFQPRLICSSGSHNTNVLDPTAGNFEASYFCRLLDKFTRRANQDNQRSGKRSSNVYPENWGSRFKWCLSQPSKQELVI